MIISAKNIEKSVMFGVIDGGVRRIHSIDTINFINLEQYPNCFKINVSFLLP